MSKIAPLLALVLVVIYILGFVIVNGHLWKFGYATYELVRGRYLAAGLSYILIITMLISPILTSLALKGSQLSFASKWPIKKRTCFFLISLVLAIAYSFGVVVLRFKFTGSGGQDFLCLTGNVAGRISIIDLLLYLTIILISFLFKGKDISRWRSHTARIIFAMLLTITSLICYSVGVYHVIPAVLGGGQPLQAQMYLDSSFMDENPSLQNTTKKNDNADSIDVEVIFEDQHGFLVRYIIGNKKHVQLIKRDYVRMVVYQKKPLKL